MMVYSFMGWWSLPENGQHGSHWSSVGFTSIGSGSQVNVCHHSPVRWWASTVAYPVALTSGTSDVSGVSVWIDIWMMRTVCQDFECYLLNGTVGSNKVFPDHRMEFRTVLPGHRKSSWTAFSLQRDLANKWRTIGSNHHKMIFKFSRNIITGCISRSNSEVDFSHEIKARSHLIPKGRLLLSFLFVSTSCWHQVKL